MARQRVGAPEGAKSEIKQFAKCECPVKVGNDVLMQSMGRCPECLRGVHVGLPDLSDADENAAKIIALRKPATPIPPAPVVVSGSGKIQHGHSQALEEIAEDDPVGPTLGKQDFVDAAVDAIDVAAAEGDEVTVKLQHERYGERDSFSSYGVPEVTWTTRVRKGEHPQAAAKRAARGAREVQDRERIVAKQRYLGHIPTAFKA